MSTASAHDFFTASAAVAGTLIGLLFVAISVSPHRIVGPDASEVHGLRAAATLTAFTNALAVALFGLVPGFNVGPTATVVAIVGIFFILAALIRVAPAWRAKRVKLGDLVFLAVLLAVFVIQLISGLALDRHEHDTDALQTICVLVIVCFLVGIGRAWELVGGQNTDLTHLLIERIQARRAPPEPGGGEEE